jgi:hypothetical protein
LILGGYVASANRNLAQLLEARELLRMEGIRKFIHETAPNRTMSRPKLNMANLQQIARAIAVIGVLPLG